MNIFSGSIKSDLTLPEQGRVRWAIALLSVGGLLMVYGSISGMRINSQAKVLFLSIPVALVAGGGGYFTAKAQDRTGELQLKLDEAVDAHARSERQLSQMAEARTLVQAEYDKLYASHQQQTSTIDGLKQSLAKAIGLVEQAKNDRQLYIDELVQERDQVQATYDRLKRDFAKQLAALNQQKGVAIFNRLKIKMKAEVDELLAPLHEHIARLQADLEKASTEKDKLYGLVQDFSSKELPDIQATFDREWTENDRRIQEAIAQLQQANAELSRPDTFPGISITAQRGNRIIEHLAERGVLLDARWFDQGDVTDTIWYYYRHLQQQPTILDDLNNDELARWVQVSLGLIDPPKFSLDSDRLLIKLSLTHSRKRIDSKAVERLFRSVDQFPTIIKNWRRIRVTGGSEAGKSPTAQNIAVCLLNQLKWEGFLSDPAHGSRKDHWVIPKIGFSHADSVRIARTLSERVAASTEEIRQFYLFDEADNTISESTDFSRYIKFVIKEGSHRNVGLLLLGQNANVSTLKGWDRSDLNNLVNVAIGANAFDTIQNTNLIADSEKSKLKQRASEIQDYFDEVNRGFDPEQEPELLRRWAMVVEPGKSPYFLELPKFGQYQELDNYRNNAEDTLPQGSALPAPAAKSGTLDLSSGHLPQTSPIETPARPAPIALICPQCRTTRLRNKGSNRYYCKTCKKSVSLDKKD